MNVKMIGLYFQTLMEQRGFKKKAIAKAAGVGENYVWRLANGEVKRPSVEKITHLVRALQGDSDLVEQLLDTDKEVSKKAMEHYIEDWIKGAHSDPIIENARRHQARVLSDEIVKHPHKLDRLLEYADRLGGSEDESNP